METPRDEQLRETLIERLALGDTFVEAAAAADCSERTARRKWNEDEGFRAQVRTRRGTIRDEASGLIVASTRAAAEALRELLACTESPWVRLRASVAVLERC